MREEVGSVLVWGLKGVLGGRRIVLLRRRVLEYPRVLFQGERRLVGGGR